MSRAAARKQSEDTELDLSKARVIGRGSYANGSLHLTLRALRTAVNKTQLELSECTGIGQGDVSKLERRTSLEELQLSTIRRYVEGLGAKLELVAVFPKGHRIAIAAAEDE